MSSAPSSSSTLHSHSLKLLTMLALCMTLSACDYFQKSKSAKTPEELMAEGVALGAACRQVGQSLETCYARNPKGLKEGIFAGWKEMHEYMATKNLETLEPSSSKDDARHERVKEKEKEREERAKERGKELKEKNAKKPDSKSDAKNSKENQDNAPSKT